MAQNITWPDGTTFASVPYVDIPKTGGGLARFTDTTPTTASAADVASGKVFFDASGNQQTGTASGGAPQNYIIRPDAELIQTWTADECIVADLGLTLPAYATSAKTIKTGATLSPTVSVDYTHYCYYVIMRGIAIPQYSTTTKQKGRCDFGASTYLYELVEIPANTIKTIDGTKTYTSRNALLQASNIGRELYWTSATAIGVNVNTTYGAYVAGQSPSISGTTLTIKAPNYGIRGHTTYMTSGAWGTMTDIREQYVIEVWRAPKGEVDGWQMSTNINNVIEAASNGGDL